MRLLTQKQKDFIKKLAKEYKILLILLFGSQANKKTHPGSDLDIGALFKKNDLGLQKYSILLSKFQKIFPEKEIDLAIINQADPLFLKKILERCQLLYGKKSDLKKLELYSFHRFLDYQKYFDLEEKFCHTFLKTLK